MRFGAKGGAEVRKRVRAGSEKAQSAMEYLTTYSWAILIIAIVLSVFYLLGAFNPAKSVPASLCTLPDQLGCLGATLASNGNLLVNVEQSTASTISITAIGCNTNGVISNMLTLTPPSNVMFGGNATILTRCYENGTVTTKRIGNLYAGYLIINYTNLASGFSHTAIGTLLVKATTPTIFTTTSTTSI